jgi:hypothetical protein
MPFPLPKNKKFIGFRKNKKRRMFLTIGNWDTKVKQTLFKVSS